MGEEKEGSVRIREGGVAESFDTQEGNGKTTQEKVRQGELMPKLVHAEW